jgi:uncharacterized FlgJ-related protein
MRKSLLVVCFLCPLFAWSTPKENVSKYQKFVDSVALHYQIPADLILGIGMCESGFGTTQKAKRLNNYFGLRGKYSKARKTSYLYFDKPEDGIVAFCEVVARKNFYEKLKGNPDAKVWIKALAKANYARNRKVWIKLVKRGIASLK